MTPKIESIMDLVALLEAGAEANMRGDSGGTPLHAAATLNTNLAVFSALLDAGADPSARNKAGQTPWDMAQGNKALRGSNAYRRL